METPHPVIVSIRDNKDYIRAPLYSYRMGVLLDSYYTTGWGAHLVHANQAFGVGVFVGPGQQVQGLGVLMQDVFGG